MKEVEFVAVESELMGFGFGKGSKYKFYDVEKIIKEKMESGWEYKGFVPSVTRATGDIETMLLIFEKEK